MKIVKLPNAGPSERVCVVCRKVLDGWESGSYGPAHVTIWEDRNAHVLLGTTICLDMESPQERAIYEGVLPERRTEIVLLCARDLAKVRPEHSQDNHYNYIAMGI